MFEELFGLSGRVAVVTGAANGIGLACARMLSQAGAKLVAADIDLKGAEAIAGEIKAAGRQALAVHLDLGDERSIESLFAEIVRTYGRLDGSVHCAADYSKHTFLDISAEAWDRLQQVTLRGTFVCMREAIKAMRQAGRGGRIVNVSSVASLHPAVYGNGCYSAAKAGVNAITRAAALEFAADGINVNAVLPGAVGGTAAQKAVLAGTMPPVIGPAASPERHIMKRLGKPEEIAAVALFLASPAASYVTGQCWAVDGGFTVS